MPKGPWIATISGKHIYPLDFRPEMVDIEDIAHALASQCRFTGHTRKFYSVAEHCVIIAEILQARDYPRQIVLQGLLHDAAEAYIGDLSNPLKQCEEFAFYKVVERGIEQTIYETFGLPRIMDPAVKALDAAMLLAEGKVFFADDIASWVYPPKDTTETLQVKFRCWSPPQAKGAFLSMFGLSE